MTAKRLVVCLDVKAGQVVKGVSFEGLRHVGDPVALARRYEAEGADELVFLDISASAEERGPWWEAVRRTAEQLFIPLTVGGGISSVDDVRAALRSGADKVSLNSSAVANPSVLTACAEAFGRQCVVVSIDAKRQPSGAWRVYTHGGRRETQLDAIAWAQQAVAAGAGEVLLTSIDRDGQRNGYDLELTAAVASAVDVPVIASGGAGQGQHVVDALLAGAEAALVAGILHEGVTTVPSLKRSARDAGLEVRL
jgi:imidazole glycerol-phosphate synthase subunit HisF